MTTFRKRLQERWWDVRDWIDFRPDPSWWIAAALMAVLTAGAFAIPIFVVGVILLASILFAIGLICLAVIGMTIAIGLQAFVDVLRIPRSPRVQHRATPIQRVGPMAKSQ